MSDDDTEHGPGETCAACGGTTDEFSGRVVQGLAEMIGEAMDEVVTSVHERVQTSAAALGVIDDPEDWHLSKFLVMAAYEAAITHAAAARALLEGRYEISGEVMTAREASALAAGRAEVAEMIANEARENDEDAKEQPASGDGAPSGSAN